jgi:hypothetical protein
MMMKTRYKNCTAVDCFSIERDTTGELICIDLTFEEVFEIDSHMKEAEGFVDISILDDIWISDESSMRSRMIRGIQGIPGGVLMNKLLT